MDGRSPKVKRYNNGGMMAPTGNNQAGGSPGMGGRSPGMGMGKSPRLLTRRANGYTANDWLK